MPIRLTALRSLGLLAMALAIATFALPSLAHADTLLIERVQRSEMVPHPKNGTSMAAVRSSLGEPVSQVGPVAGNKPQHPRITGWVYPRFTVYFERERVLYSVINQSAPEEIGPAPLRR